MIIRVDGITANVLGDLLENFVKRNVCLVGKMNNAVQHHLGNVNVNQAMFEMMLEIVFLMIIMLLAVKMVVRLFIGTDN